VLERAATGAWSPVAPFDATAELTAVALRPDGTVVIGTAGGELWSSDGGWHLVTALGGRVRRLHAAGDDVWVAGGGIHRLASDDSVHAVGDPRDGEIMDIAVAGGEVRWVAASALYRLAAGGAGGRCTVRRSRRSPQPPTDRCSPSARRDVFCVQSRNDP